jgi:methylenetetrahydrofolate dehydrogenase (NADP+)/methenyltetrahydrofolate cyclohydrolase
VAWLRTEGAEVENIDEHTPPAERTRMLQKADIIISGVGKPGILLPEDVREGVVILDAGASETGGVIAGDADPRVAAKSSLFTPVPGGIGPLVVAFLLQNAVTLADARLRSA